MSYHVYINALDQLSYSNQKLNSPYLGVRIDFYGAKFHDCLPAKRVSKMKIGQHWSGYGVFVSGVFWEGNSSDSYNAGNSPGGQSVCLTKLP